MNTDELMKVFDKWLTDVYTEAEKLVGEGDDPEVAIKKSCQLVNERQKNKPRFCECKKNYTLAHYHGIGWGCSNCGKPQEGQNDVLLESTCL